MVSNDDVQFITEPVNLQSLSQIDASESVHIWDVPAGKRWILRAVESTVGASREILLEVIPSAGSYAVDLERVAAGQYFRYHASCDIRIPSLSRIQVRLVGGFTTMSTQILFEEETEY